MIIKQVKILYSEKFQENLAICFSFETTKYCGKISLWSDAFLSLYTHFMSFCLQVDELTFGSLFLPLNEDGNVNYIKFSEELIEIA